MVTKFEMPGYTVAIHGKNIQVTDPLKNYVFDKLAKIEKFSHHLIDAAVVLEVQKIEHRVDVILHFDHITIKVRGVSNNLYAAIDEAMDRLRDRVRKYKDRIREHQGRKRLVTEMDVSVYKSDEELINEEIDEENARREKESYRIHEIVRREKQPLKTLLIQEAILKMELSCDPFLLFRSEEDQKIKVIYRMEDGNFGLLEPK